MLIRSFLCFTNVFNHLFTNFQAFGYNLAYAAFWVRTAKRLIIFTGGLFLNNYQNRKNFLLTNAVTKTPNPKPAVPEMNIIPKTVRHKTFTT